MRQKIIFSLLDQAIVSAFNFILNFYLIKSWSPESFGWYSILTAIALFAAMLQNALINTPLAVHHPLASSIDEQLLLVRVFSTTNLILTLLVLIISLVGLWLWLGMENISLVWSASIFITVYFFREFYRAQLAVDGRLKGLFIVDVFYVSSVILTLLTIHFLGDSSFLKGLPGLFVIMSFFGFASVIVFLAPRRSFEVVNFKAEALLVFPKQMNEIKWSLLGVLTTDLQNRGYIYIAAVFFGPITVATLQAGRIFFGPLNLLTSAWARVARPRLASLAGASEYAVFNKTLFQALRAFAAFNLVFLFMLFCFWHDLTNFLFKDKYVGLGLIVAGWGVANFAFQMRSCLSVGVQAIRHFKSLTLATIYGAVFSMLILILACYIRLPNLMVFSVISGELLACLVIFNILKRECEK